MDASKSTKRTALIVASFASFMNPFMGSAINIALPKIGSEMQAGAVTLSWLATAYLLASAVFLVPFGRIADIVGRKKIFQIGLASFTAATAFCLWAPTIEWLLIARIAQGAGSALIFGTAIAIITSVYPPGERGKAMGIAIASVYMGLTLGPFAGGWLVEMLGWRSIFGFTLVLGLISLGLSLRYLKGEWAEARGQKMDWTGSIIYGVSLTAFMYGVSSIQNPWGVESVVLGVAGFVLFFWFESKQQSPVLNMRLFRTNRVFAFSNLAALINYSATFAIAFLLSLYLQYIKSFSAAEAGTILAIQPVLMAVFSPFTGRLSDKIAPQILASAGMALIALGLFAMIFISKDTSMTFIVVNLIIFGIGYALFSSPNTNAIMSSVERKHFGIASGMVGTMRLVGQISSIALATMIFNVFLGNQEIQPENYPQFISSVKTDFLIFAILCLVGVFFSLARGKQQKI
jgi:EmrB/QacA subfamily drug resistance transporter